MVPFRITIPQMTGQKKSEGNRDEREIARELIAVAENFYYNNQLLNSGYCVLRIMQKSGGVLYVGYLLWLALHFYYKKKNMAWCVYLCYA